MNKHWKLSPTFDLLMSSKALSQPNAFATKQWVITDRNTTFIFCTSVGMIINPRYQNQGVYSAHKGLFRTPEFHSDRLNPQASVQYYYCFILTTCTCKLCFTINTSTVLVQCLFTAWTIVITIKTFKYFRSQISTCSRKCKEMLDINILKMLCRY